MIDGVRNTSAAALPSSQMLAAFVRSCVRHARAMNNEHTPCARKRKQTLANCEPTSNPTDNTTAAVRGLWSDAATGGAVHATKAIRRKPPLRLSYWFRRVTYLSRSPVYTKIRARYFRNSTPVVLLNCPNDVLNCPMM
jgi:hypothetical protein